MSRAFSTASPRHFWFVFLLMLTAAVAGNVAGCGDDDPKPPATDEDSGVVLDGGRIDAPIGTDGGGSDGGTDANNDSATTDAADASDATTDADDAGDASDASDAGNPTIAVDSVSLAEGSSGTTTFTFTVSLSEAATGTVTVDYATADGTATTSAAAAGGADYTAANGTVTFNAGETSKTITVSVSGDGTNEADETFTVTLSNAQGGTIGTGTGTGTITNDDATPAISIADAIVVEGNTGTTPATFAVTLSAASGQTVSVTYKTANGTATGGADFTAIADTVLTFAPGETQKNVVVDVTGEAIIEPAETFTVELSAPSNATIADGNATATIQNDDGATQPNITIDDPSITEGNAGTKVLNFTISLSAAAASVVTVDYATVSGTATTAGNDYQATSGTETFALGETSKQVSVVIVGDTANEDNETFTVSLTGATNALITKASGTGTITNDDAVPTYVINDVAVSEGQAGTTNLSFTVTLSAASGKQVTVDYATADGTAIAGGTAATGGLDYSSASGTVTFAPGTTTQPIVISVAGDTLNEANETLTVALSNATNANAGAKVSGTGTINNDDLAPLIVINSASVAEGDTGTADLTFTVSLVNAASNPAPSGRTVTVNYATANVTAVAPGDYGSATNTLTFLPSETQKTITVQAVGDTTAETNETFNVVLSGAVNATIQTGTGVGTIQNDDGNLPLLTITDEAITEGNAGTQTMTFTVTLSAPSSQNVTVNYATQNGTAISGGVLANGGQDYVALATQTLTYLPGETSKTINVTINGDVANEADETFNVVLSNPSTTAAIQDNVGVGTINNDDLVPTLSINDQTVVEGNSGTSTMTFTVTLSAISGRTVGVSFATADDTARQNGLVPAGGTDYNVNTNNLSFAPGETSKTISIVINGDTTVEPTETFNVNLSSPVNATLSDGTGVGTITNDDSPPQVTINNVTLAEGTPAPNTADTTNFTFTVTLSNPSAQTVTVAYATANGTATLGNNDYDQSAGTLSFAPGETTKTIVILVQKDNAAEGNETFFINLNAATNATISDNQGQGTINNDD